MAIAGTFSEPIAKFNSYSEYLHERILCDDETTIDQMIADAQSSNEYYNATSEGTADDPISEDEYFHHSQLWIYGFTKEEILEYYYGLKRLKYSWTANFSVQWHQKKIGDRYGYNDNDNDNDLMNPNLNVIGGNYDRSITYSAIREDSENDWIIPQERCCHYSNDGYTIEGKTRQQHNDEFFNSDYAQRPNYSYRYEVPSLHGSYLCHKKVQGKGYALGFFTSPIYLVSARYDQYTWAIIKIGSSSHLGQGTISQYYTSSWNKHFKVPFTFKDEEIGKQVDGEYTITAVEKSEDLTTSVGNFHMNIEVERFQFQK
jgi:hypothetical protein